MSNTSKPYTELKTLFLSKGAHLNDQGELILVPAVNTYISVQDKNRRQIIEAVLEKLSREACISEPYDSGSQNKKYQSYIRDAMNEFLEQHFSKDDYKLIYKQLGNGIDRPLTEEFIDSDYDLKILGQISLF